LFEIGFEQVEWQGGGYGYINLVIIEPKGSHYGGMARRSRMHPCIVSAWTRDNVITAAHEVGHMLGLDHLEEDQHNIMYPYYSPNRDELEEWQLEIVRQGAERLVLCKP
jgi:hypothetical protein